MAEKNDLLIKIGTKELTITSEDSAEHMQNIADFVNEKLVECEETDSFKMISPEMRTIILELNLADEYLKVKSSRDDALLELSERNKELYDLKHELISLKMNYDTCKKQVEELQENAAMNAAKIIKLETELKKK